MGGEESRGEGRCDGCWRWASTRLTKYLSGDATEVTVQRGLKSEARRQIEEPGFVSMSRHGDSLA